jgi:hypothetical protein
MNSSTPSRSGDGRPLEAQHNDVRKEKSGPRAKQVARKRQHAKLPATETGQLCQLSTQGCALTPAGQTPAGRADTKGGRKRKKKARANGTVQENNAAQHTKPTEKLRVTLATADSRVCRREGALAVTTLAANSTEACERAKAIFSLPPLPPAWNARTHHKLVVGNVHAIGIAS